jgi:hypothetical protein
MNMTGSVTGSRLPMNYQPQDINNAMHGTPDLDGVTQDWLQGQVPEDFLVCNGLGSWHHSIPPQVLLRPRRASSDPGPDWQSSGRCEPINSS